MPSSSLNILYEDNHLLAINKPAGLATMGVPTSQTSLLDLARQHVKRKYHKPGNVYLGVVSRLECAGDGCRAAGPHVEGRQPVISSVSPTRSEENLLGFSR